ncbi:MAG: type I-U CRISPR-associated protein Csx17 [Cyanobacteriota bacterium]
METNLASTPLSSYLSALGLLKITSTQLPGSAAAGAWSDGHFQLELSLSPSELSTFLANRYQPSPCLTPWNKPKSGGPGFLEGQVPGAIAALSDPRFEELRRVAATAARVMPQFVEGGKVKGDAKRLAFEALSRHAQSDAFAAWLQICAVAGMDAKGKPFVRYPALLGGTAGFLAADFGDQFVASLTAAKAEHFEAAIFGSSARNVLLKAGNSLIYDPAGRGDGQQGYRVAISDVQTTTANPAELILLAEGMSFFQGYATTVQQEGQEEGGARQASFTLAVAHNTSGHASSSWLENDGQPAEELWCPLWDDPVTFQELRDERARVALLPLPRQLRTGTDFALFASQLGRRHGLSGFARYCFPPRVGQGTKIPSLIEVFPLQDGQEDRNDALAGVAKFASTLRRRAADRSIPTSYRNSAEQVVAELEALSGGGGSFTTLLRNLVAWRRQEDLKPEEDRLHRFGLGRRELPPQWFSLLERELDGTTWRLALAFGTGEVLPNPRLAPLATGRPYAGLADVLLLLEGRIDDELVNDLSLGVAWIERRGLPKLPPPESHLPWLPPDYLAGVLLNQWHFDAHSPVEGDRARWRELLLAGRPEEAMEVALHRLQVAEVVSWPWPAITTTDPARLLRAVEVRINPITLERAMRRG